MSLMKALSEKFGSFQDELGKLGSGRANKDVLEAMVAGCVIVGAADGDYSEKEKDETIDSISTSKFVESAGFSTAQISDVVNKYAGYRPGSRAGRERLLEEIREAGRRPETEQFAKAVFMSWVDVAEKQDGISEAEKKALVQCGDAIGIRNCAELI